MRFIGIIGSHKEESYNRKLLEFARLIMVDQMKIDLFDLTEIPIFNPDLDINSFVKLLEIAKAIEASDGVIIASPEINYTIPSKLKSLIEWLSYDIHPFINKPVMLMGASTGPDATIRAQAHLRDILIAPGLEAIVMPASDFLLANAAEKFDEDGRLIDEQTEDFLEHCLLRFEMFCQKLQGLDYSNILSKYSLTIEVGGYINLDDPESDAISGPSEY